LGERVIRALCPEYTGDVSKIRSGSAELANSTPCPENARLYEQAERVATLEERQRIAADS
jgi:hypothetical protein